ncbi:MAG TPA: polyprenyl synthetase family protein [Nitrososphaerales archaeon]|nr:polyprenyl synthetase family protein [Nitrososphaerales archaeon]
MTMQTDKMLSEMARVKAAVDKLILDDFLPKSSPIREVDLLYKMLRDYPARPAKGMRALMCVSACKAFGGKEEDVLTTAACIEIFQHWILIHDDIEDGSEMRRGSPALHKKYDWRLALNAGDALHALMWGVLLQNKKRLTDEKTLRVMEEFHTMVSKTTEGQHIELGWVVGNRWNLTEQDYITMCTHKTSWYTVIGPMRVGGVVGGADNASMKLLVDAGKNLGVGFQIHDDILNLSGDQSKYGKEIGDDLLEGKRTLMLIRLLSLCSDAERDKVVSYFKLPRDRRKQGANEVMDLLLKYDTIDYARRMSSRLVNEARAMLREANWKEGSEAAEAVDCLDAVAKFAVERDW